MKTMIDLIKERHPKKDWESIYRVGMARYNEQCARGYTLTECLIMSERAFKK